MNAGLPPDPLEGKFADVELIAAAVHAEVDVCVWVATGGTDGCARCSPVVRNADGTFSHPPGLSFAERIARGHADCARELARDEGARAVAGGLRAGGLTARLVAVVEDPRLGAWRSHLDDWAAREARA